jgi:aerobic-type carbon monoxide dehydrogenase small subunit (CoxS/CutS family)
MLRARENICDLGSENKMPKEKARETEEEKSKESFTTLSRRKFLKDAGMIAGGGMAGSMAAVSPITAGVPAGTGAAASAIPDPMVTRVVETAVTGPQKIKLNVNGAEYEVQVDPEESLRDCLREKLGYLSIKDICLGHGACGSCTVIMDGRPVLSCLTLAIECDGRKIETAEGIALSRHPLIETYIMNYCMQCGYCTPGFLCTSKALLDKNPNPTEAVIREALAGNLCRCATYLQHIPAVQQAARALKEGV